MLVRAVAERIHADTVDLLRDALPDLTGYDCVFFASGIYFNTFHRSLMDVIGRTAFDGKRACLLYTCGLRYRDYARPAARLLVRQGAAYGGSFGCRGLDTYGMLKRTLRRRRSAKATKAQGMHKRRPPEGSGSASSGGRCSFEGGF